MNWPKFDRYLLRTASILIALMAIGIAAIEMLV